MDSYPTTPIPEKLNAEEDPLNAREEGVTCSICLDVLVRPIVLECQHVVCRPCYLDYLEANKNGWRLGLLPGWEIGVVVCPLGRCEIPAGCPPVNTVLQHLIESRYSSYIKERVKMLPPVAQEAKRAQALDEVGLAARAAEWPHPDWNPWTPDEPEANFEWRTSPRTGAIAWCIELAFIASLVLVYNIQWNRALSRQAASPAGKSVWATRRVIRGMDFACAEDADGSTPDACQIRRAALRTALVPVWVRLRLLGGVGAGIAAAVVCGSRRVSGWVSGLGLGVGLKVEVRMAPHAGGRLSGGITLCSS